MTDAQLPFWSHEAEGRIQMNITVARYIDAFRLYVEFSDGTSGTANLQDEIDSHSAFASLGDVALFRQVLLDGGTVAWPGGLDLASERVYALAHGLPIPATFEAVQANELTVSQRIPRS